MGEKLDKAKHALGEAAQAPAKGAVAAGRALPGTIANLIATGVGATVYGLAKEAGADNVTAGTLGLLAGGALRGSMSVRGGNKEE